MQACRRIVNENQAAHNSPSRSPELLAKYCDLLLKKGGGNLKIEETELEERLNQIVRIPIYIVPFW